MLSELSQDLFEKLIKVLNTSSLFKLIFERSHQIQLKDWYVAGGCVTQTVWNWVRGLEPFHGLKDVDLVYFDAKETEEDEIANRISIQKLFIDLPIPTDIINEARVHEWYPAKFGYEIEPYKSCEDGVSTWLPAFSVGIRPESSGFKIIAPFGLEDTFEMIVRPNKRQITEDIYKQMVCRLRKDWPSIRSLPWK